MEIEGQEKSRALRRPAPVVFIDIPYEKMRERAQKKAQKQAADAAVKAPGDTKPVEG